jgi:hypothetical protein
MKRTKRPQVFNEIAAAQLPPSLATAAHRRDQDRMTFAIEAEATIELGFNVVLCATFGDVGRPFSVVLVRPTNSKRTWHGTGANLKEALLYARTQAIAEVLRAGGQDAAYLQDRLDDQKR